MTTRFRQSAPAKLNLFLAITGRRESDGFHNLVSLAVPLDFGDEVEVSVAESSSVAASSLRLVSEIGDDVEVPLGGDNLVLRAGAAFRAASGFSQSIEFILKKRVPVGAGLGGGSSDAVAALRGLNCLAALAGAALSEKTLSTLAAELGADCAFFACGKPAIMRGKGERIEPVRESLMRQLCGRVLFVCKPPFGVNTAWAYAEMAASSGGRYYLAEEEAEKLVAHWFEEERASRLPEQLTFNTMEEVVFRKYPALPVLAAVFREKFGLTLRMSGSGSACFAFLPDSVTEQGDTSLVYQLRDCVHEYWGSAAFTRLVRVAV